MNVITNSKNYVVIFLGLVLFVLLVMFFKKSTDNVLNGMQVVITAKVQKDDVFQFFFWEAKDKNFTIEKSVRTAVKGADTYQEITFSLPDLKDLHRIRLDIGENKEQDPIDIQIIRFIKGDDMLTFDRKEFSSLFGPNEFITPNNNTGAFHGKSISSKGKLIYDPYFVSVDGSKEMSLIESNRLTEYPYLVAAFIVLVFCLFALVNIGKVIISREAIFIAFFLIMLILPTVQSTFHFTKLLPNIEKREMAKKPDFSFSKEFARDYEIYYSDNFGLRNNLINWGGTYRTKFFKSSMHPELVLYGKDKWLFYNRMGGRMYRSYSRTALLSEDRLKELVNKWEDYKRRYEADGIKHFMSFWPNKHSIYPEYMPYTMKIQIRDTLSRVDQIMEYIQRTNSPVKLLDVRPTLIEEKRNNLLFHKFDTHWNDYGAFLAYQQFFKTNMDRLGFEPKSISDFNITWKDYGAGELIQMLGVHNKGFFVEKNPRFELKENKDQIEYLTIEGFPRLTVITKNEICGNKLRVLVYRDSFTNSLIQFFSLHFYEVYYIWGHQEEFVEKLKPDIIIDCFVEREIGERIS